MCTSTSTELKKLKRTFFAIEAFVLFACVYGLALRITWRYDVGEHPHMMTAYRLLLPLLLPMLFAFTMACGVLLLAAPFFIRRLGSAALVAWAIGALSFVWAYLCLFHL